MLGGVRWRLKATALEYNRDQAIKTNARVVKGNVISRSLWREVDAAQPTSIVQHERLLPIQPPASSIRAHLDYSEGGEFNDARKAVEPSRENGHCENGQHPDGQRRPTPRLPHPAPAARHGQGYRCYGSGAPEKGEGFTAI